MTKKGSNSREEQPNPTTHPIIRTSFGPPSSSSRSSVALHDWWLVRADGQRIAVAGFASRERLGARIFCSAPISRRYDATTLETADGISITICGFLNKSRTHQNGFSSVVYNQFLLGFPYNWEEFATQDHGEEFAKRGVWTTQSGSLEQNTSAATNANSFLPVPLDDLPVTQLRDIFMSLPEDSEISIWDIILGEPGSNISHYIPVTGHSLVEKINQVINENSLKNENQRSHKILNTEQLGDNVAILSTRNKEKEKFFTPSRGVVTRGAYRSTNPRNKQGEDSPSDSSFENKNVSYKLEEKHSANAMREKVCANILTPHARKNCLRGQVTRTAVRGSPMATHRQNELIVEVPGTSTVRRSARLKIRKNYAE